MDDLPGSPDGMQGVTPLRVHRLLRSSQQFPSNRLGKGGERWGWAFSTCSDYLAIRRLNLSTCNESSGW
jgi:hypothetical protein